MTIYYPIARLLIVVAFITLNGFGVAFGQAPNITYPTPQNYTAGKSIPPLSPTNTGGAVPAESYGVTTFAGSTGTGGTFGFINGVTNGGQGSLYVTDGSQRVLKITPDGVLTVMAGTKNVPGNLNGQGTAALFNNPSQVITDPAGNIYVADQQNNMIREITPAGVVTTYAGTGAAGSADGPAASATFWQPSGIVFDGFGNLYVADFNNNVIRKIAPGGTVSTFAGLSGSAGFKDGTGGAARFSGPRYLAIDASGNIYVSDFNNAAIRKITPAGVVTTLAGSGAAGFQNGIGNLASFNQPGGMTIDPEGNVYVADEGNFSIRRITPAGVVTTYAGTGQQGATNGYPLTSIKFADPRDITIDATGNFYIADGGQIRKINVSGYTIDKPLPPGLNFDTSTGIITGMPTAPSPLTNYTVTAYNTSASSSFTIQIAVNPANTGAIQPPNISYFSPQVYPEFKTITPLAPNNSGGVVPATVYGQVSAFAGSGTPGSADGVGKAASFSYPFGIALAPTGNFFVAETVNSTVREITPQALVSTFAGTATKTGYVEGQGTAARFAGPMGVAVDAAGNIYVADAANNVIRKITPGGSVSTYAGNGTPGNANGSALQASFNQPVGVAIDVYGNLYVVDQKNNLIRKITPSGTVSTFAGSGAQGDVNGPALQATFNQPYGIAIDANGNIFVSDQNYIREINTSGIVSTFAGSGAQGSADGIGAAASFNKPEGLAFDAAGDLYVADTGNDMIREITPQQRVITVGKNVTGSNPNEKNFNQPAGIVIDQSGNAFITEFWGGLGSSGTGGNIITELILTGYTIDKLLPSGLTFDSRTGIISGTPVVLSPPTNYTITAYNGGGSSSFVVTISVVTNEKKTQTITFNPLPAKIYGDTDFTPGATSDNNSIPVTYTSGNTGVATIVNGMIHITGAGTSEITASQAGNDDYTAATPVVQELTVGKAPLLIIADNKTKYENRPNPPLTFTALGFVYNENASVLTEQPVLSTTATADSPPGDYVISITGGQAANYDINDAPGTLTINVSELSIIVPNAFTPNGDGINDYWDIKAVEGFPQCLVSVFARNGSMVFQSRGYPKPWDGTYKGSPLPTGTYYYVINPADGLKLLSGYVTILR